MDDPINRIRNLPVWQGEVGITPLAGGLTNLNYVVTDAGKKYVVRLGRDIVEHHVMRFNELAASRAAHRAGLSPAVVYSGDGVTVLDFIEGKTLSAADIAAPEMLEKIVPLVQTCHRDMPNHLRGPAMIFWVFHVIRDYAATLVACASPYSGQMADLLHFAGKFEQAAGPFDIVYGHNDLLAANFLDDGRRLWLIDWDYAGYNTPLFDLGGLASNCQLDEARELLMLELYFGAAPDGELMHRYQAMKCASLLRETLWSMVSETKSVLDVDYSAYTAENQARFQRACGNFFQT